LTQKINFKAPSPKNRNPAAVPAPEMSWKPVTYSKKYQLQVAKDLDFTKPEVYEVKNTKILWNQFKGGHSYYRVFALGDNGKKSPSSDVGEVFVELNSPLLQPLKPMVSVSAKNSAQETRASWTAIPDAHSYLVQMDTNDQFATPQSYEFKTNEGRWNVNAPGEYKVRVRALDEGNNPLTDFSNVEILKFTYHPRLVTPLLLEPYDKISIFLQQASEPSIWVEWRKVDGAELYKVEVSDRADFSHILISSAVSGNRFLLKDKVPLGTIYWRVRAQSRDESEISAWTEKRQFTIYHQKNETF
ncbi:MAG TPA: hypothetical protein VN132_12875, partial [Bdellovibrio sp.]|nr:hypothetical protein [Bdellovibrio sp.]